MEYNGGVMETEMNMKPHRLTRAQAREIDRLSIGQYHIPGIVLMENAGNRVVDFLIEKFAPLGEHRVVILCGKGNNGGDGLVVARQLYTRRLAASRSRQPASSRAQKGSSGAGGKAGVTRRRTT